MTAIRGAGGDRFYDDNQWIGIAYMDAQPTKDIACAKPVKEI